MGITYRNLPRSRLNALPDTKTAVLSYYFARIYAFLLLLPGYPMSDYKYEDAVKQLQESGAIGLQDFKNLSYEDLTELLEEIKVWCLYANGKLDKLPKESKKKKEKKDKKDKKD
jgi:hypothetical protein